MNILGLIDAAILWFYGLLIFTVTVKNWHHPHKTDRIKYSEIVYALTYVIIGFYVLFLFEGQGTSDANQTLLYGILMVVFLAVIGWLWILNVLYTYIRIHRHPELMEENAIQNRNYEKFLTELHEKYKNDSKNDDIIKDLSRKLLHFILLGVVIFIFEITTRNESVLQAAGFTPMAFRNFGYLALGFFFIFMFTTEDMVRVYKFHLLPEWAKKWLGKSLEPKSESYTYISSIPFLLTTLLFIFAPIQVLFGGLAVSCIGDAAASIIGKSYGRHKMTNFGIYPHKSFEGLIAGALSTFLGVILVFQVDPLQGVTEMFVIIFGILAAAAFVYIDAFSKYIVDNVLNTLIPGVLIWLAIAFFI